jgi:hypothetical protein
MTLHTLKRVMFWSLFTLGVIVSVWWILVVPYRAGAVLELIPENAAWVSIHRAPAARWAEWSSNGVVRAVTGTAGLDLASFEKELAIPRSRAWFDRLGGREVVIAYVPEMPGSGAPAWVISCWAGGYSQRMRWLFALAGFKPLSGPLCDPAHPIWRLKMKGMPPGMSLSLGIREGVVAMVVSPDPLAVRACLEAAEGVPFARSVRKAGIEARMRELMPNPNSPDRGWLRMPGSATEWVFKADTLTADRIHATAWSKGPIPETLSKPASGDPAALAGLKALAEGTVEAPWPWVRGLLADRAGMWLGPLDALVRDAAGTDEARIVAAVYGGDHAARIRSLFGGGVEDFIQGLKVPTFVMAVPVTDEAAAQAAASRFLDQVNRIKPFGLVLRPAGVCYGWNVTAVEGTRGEIYKDFLPAEQAAFTVAGGWLVIGSHLGALEGLIPAIPHEAKAAGPGVAPSVVVRIDGPAFGQTMGKFLAALSLVYMVADTPSAEKGREQTAVAREWLKSLGSIGELRAECVTTSAMTVLSIEAGRADTP